MSDKLQDVAERFIAEYSRITEERDKYGDSYPGSDSLVVDVADLRAFLAQYVLCESEPFGYFKAEPFGWTDCAETDEGAMPLYTPAKGVE
jgi:hypothetical protein